MLSFPKRMGLSVNRSYRQMANPMIPVWHQGDGIELDIENYAVLADNAGNVVHRWGNELSGGGQRSYWLDHDGLLCTCVRDVETASHVD